MIRVCSSIKACTSTGVTGRDGYLLKALVVSQIR
jgi:hypothetical protein